MSAAALLVAFLLSFAPASYAALVDHGAFLRDTDNGIDYLKLEHTLGLSFDDATAAEAVFAGEAGWMLASFSQIDALSVADRLTLIDPASGGGSYAVFMGLPDDGHISADGVTAKYWFALGDGSLITNPDLSVVRSVQVENLGALLARPVPLPAAGWLLLTALSVLWGRKHCGGCLAE